MSLDAMKLALDAQMVAEIDAGYVIVRAQLPDDGRGGCHSCGELQVVDFTALFERDASTMESHMHIAVVCAECRGSQEKLARLGDSVVAHGQELRRKYGDAVVVQQAVPSV